MDLSMIIFTVLAVLALFGTAIALLKRYKRCPSDKLLVVYGKTGGDGTAKVYHGGGKFIWPIIQDYEFLELQPMAIDIDLRGALTSQNIRIDVPATFTVAISRSQDVMLNAAERLLGMTKQGVANLAKDLIYGQLRLVIATMTIEEINADRDTFLAQIQENLESELAKVGLDLVNVNITDIQDESGYINALGKEAAAKAINDAKVSVAEKTRDGDIGQAEANKEQRIKTSELRSLAEVGEAEARAKAEIGQSDASSKQRARVAELNAKAVTGENTAAIDIAETTSARKVAEADASKRAIIAQNVAQAKSKEETYIAQKLAEETRSERDKATLYADTIVPAEISRDELIVKAQAEAESIREIAKGKADAVFLEKEAEAKGIKEIMNKQAEGFTSLVKSAGGNADKAIQMMITDKLPELMKIQVDALKNVQIDTFNIWDSGNGGDGNGSGVIGNHVKDLLSSVAPMESILSMTGTELPGFLQGALQKESAKLNAKKDEVIDITNDDNEPSDEEKLNS